MDSEDFPKVFQQQTRVVIIKLWMPGLCEWKVVSVNYKLSIDIVGQNKFCIEDSR